MESDPEREGPILSRAPNPSHQPLLRAAKSTAFKREERRKRKERKRQDRLALEFAHWEPLGAPPRPAATSPSRVPPDDTPWPCDQPSHTDPASSVAWSWGPPVEPPPQPSQPLALVTCPQASAARACRALFGKHVDEEDDDTEEEGEEGNVTRFFEELLGQDAGLRDFYVAEKEMGRFMCLVCEGIGAKAGKRFAGCAALVQHAGSVARTKRRLAHRAFADAIGRLLGWGTGGRTTPLMADPVIHGACDQAEAEHFDPSQIAEMDMA